MEFELILNKTKYRIQIDPGQGNVRKVRVDNRDYYVNLLPMDGTQTGQRTVKIDDKDYLLKMLKHKLELGRAEFELELNDKFAVLEALIPHIHKHDEGFVQDSSNNIAADPVTKDRGAAVSKAAESAPTAAEGGVYAPMPGRLVALKVAKGDKVKAGQVVAILEAMKMENELKAPTNGTVKSINYNQGDNVRQDKPIMIIE
jgi:biotin carboxyl carrier protein